TLFGPGVVVTRRLSASAGDCGAPCDRQAQQMTQTRSPSLMHGATHQHFHSFQIDVTGLAQSAEDDPEHAGYFLADLLLDRLGRFFSSGVSVSSTGRMRQIFSLTFTKSRLNCW